MTPVVFPQVNKVFTKPEEMTDDQCGDLPVCATKDQNGAPIIVACFEPSHEEMQEIKRTGKVWLTIVGHGMPPVGLHGFDPFPQPEPVQTNEYDRAIDDDIHD